MSLGEGIAVGLSVVAFWAFASWALYLLLTRTDTDSARMGAEEPTMWRSKDL